MNYTIVAQPSVEPITLSEAKLFLRVDSTIEDAIITALIKAARQYVENYTWRPLCTQIWKLNLDKSDVKEYIGISQAPVQSITHIKYFDESKVQQTLSTGSYQADVLNEPARVKINTIPGIFDMMNACEIQFVCGYGVAASVPESIKQAMLLMIGHWYEHREAVTVSGSKGMQPVPMAVQAILEPYKNTWFYPY